ncbi:MAG: hypothetical protein WC893_02660 [Candidatus Paceibacterota bacterium]
MKTYTIIVTIIAILAIVGAGYFFWQYNSLADVIDSCQKDKALAENQLVFANEQLTKIAKTVSAFKTVNESFLIPGDLKAINVGSKEAVLVEQKIVNIVDNQDRMGAEREWKDFKTSLNLNSLFSLFRNFANNLERILSQSK